MKYGEVTDFMYNLMSKYRSDKNAMIFKETADELNMAILKNQNKSDTRWAQKDLASKVAFFLNAPTFLQSLEEKLKNVGGTEIIQG